MSSTYIPTTLRRLVEERANYRCEYCLIPAFVVFFPHEIDHVVAKKHGGETDENNLAFTCWRCNRYKGTDLGSFDPQTGEFCFLFNPRTQKWSEHFAFDKLKIMGQTAIGRTTVRLLQLNSHKRLTERQRLNILPEV